MTTIKLLKLKFTKEDLKVLKKEEVIFVLQVGGILQEVSTIQKLIYISSKGVKEDVERMAENMQAVYFLRLLASALYEGWSVLSHRKYKYIISEYKKNMDKKIKDSLDYFFEYFKDQKSVCKKIRDNYAYHSNYGKILEAYQIHPIDDPLEIYLSDSHANCRYLASDVIMISSMLDINSVEDLSTKMPSYIKEIQKVASCFIEISGDFIFEILKTLKQTIHKQSEKINIVNAPNIEDLRLHYFVTGNNS